ncbi:MAG TPA: AraC family ligand binding domain-containing protein [Candidatus Dormibacteraeota bacterium]|nr:AraC family ligand binding domain-containing protein [Candidatus Dormibacteraeota bacterium]
MAGRLGPGRGGGLERSCGAGEWVTSRGPWGGIELLRARFSGPAFGRHRHATYAIGVTEIGVQEFDYRGRTERSLPGQVVILIRTRPTTGVPAPKPPSATAFSTSIRP